MNVFLFIFIIIAIVFLAIYFYVHNAELRGYLGEKWISLKLNKLSYDYYVFNDVYININGRSIQIDHVIISVYGIFVIETKNYKGWITGSENSDYWTQNIYGNKYQFRNPIKQNYSHIAGLMGLFGLPQDVFIPIVVFLNNASLNCNTNKAVINSRHLLDFIGHYSTPIFNHGQMSWYVQQLSDLNNTNRNRKRTHIHNIREDINERDHLIEKGICPICKGKLVERQGKYGKFWGCSNYPSCHFTLPTINSLCARH